MTTTQNHMSTNHPPLWRFDGHGINDANGRRICKLTSGEVQQYDSDGKRNPEFDRLSVLISAAPELLEALQALVDCPDYRRIKTHEMRAAKAAIAKATGGSK